MPSTFPEYQSSFQCEFHRRWNHLNDPHVRALAWLLDAPDLLDAGAPQWRGRIGGLGSTAGSQAAQWLAALDAKPATLHALLQAQPHSRLGRYAEQLIGFYFRHQGSLLAQGLQVCTGDGRTVGEFDFLLREGERLTHWEFATKFYLLHSHENEASVNQADYFVGPNLADTLGAKMRKILERQLSLSEHPAAQAHLPQPISSAQALIKGWLFYPDLLPAAPAAGLSVNHCRGFWCTPDQMPNPPAARYLVLPRLSWLAPAKAGFGDSVSRETLQSELAAHFQHDSMPRLIALVEEHGDHWLETSRGFVVPEQWRAAARERTRQEQ